jgi:hypothetical protein
MLDSFIDYIEQIYYPGYAEQKAKEDPQSLNYEYQLFLATYDL